MRFVCLHYLSRVVVLVVVVVDQLFLLLMMVLLQFSFERNTSTMGIFARLAK